MSLIGNEHVQNALQKDLPSPLLFHGIAGIGKRTFAKAYFDRLQIAPCDRRTFVPEGKAHVHTVAAMQTLVREATLTPFSSPKKGFLLEEADRLTDASANALLKTLEEHPPFLAIVLIATNPEDLLPTIRSRCTHIPFHPATPKDLATFLQCPETDPHIALAAGSFGKANSLEITEGERLLRQWLASPQDRAPLLALDKLTQDDKALGHNLLLLLSRLLKDHPELFPALERAELGYRHHIRLSTALQILPFGSTPKCS